MNTANPTWYILGAGAIGCLWAAYWRQMGFNVVLITPTARPSNTLALENRTGRYTFPIEWQTVAAISRSNITINQLLVCTKAQHTLTALREIRAQLSPHSHIVILQNGMASLTAKQQFPELDFYTAITSDGAYRTAPLSVVHAGYGETFIDADPAFIESLPNQYLTITPCDDIQRRQWQKLAINCAINALTAIYRCKNGELLNNAEAMQRITVICQEIKTISAKLHCLQAVAELEQQVIDTLSITAANYSSMYQDIAQGRDTEIEQLNGFICQQGLQLGIPCPENQAVYQAIRQRQRQHAN